MFLAEARASAKATAKPLRHLSGFGIERSASPNFPLFAPSSLLTAALVTFGKLVHIMAPLICSALSCLPMQTSSLFWPTSSGPLFWGVSPEDSCPRWPLSGILLRPNALFYTILVPTPPLRLSGTVVPSHQGQRPEQGLELFLGLCPDIPCHHGWPDPHSGETERQVCPGTVENPWLGEGPWKFLNVLLADLDLSQKAVKHLPSDLQGGSVLPATPTPTTARA